MADGPEVTGAPFDVHAEVLAAHARLRGHLLRTPLVPSDWLSAAAGGDVRLKLENVQLTGSFKARGAWNRLLTLPDDARRRGVTAASSGNHGLGVAHAARALGCPATIFVPAATATDKRTAIAALGAEVVPFGDDCVETEAHARRVATERGCTYVSPYNDAGVIAGQGTIAVELLEQWPEVEVVYVAVGGGGLIGGMAGYARREHPSVEWVGCSPLASPAMAECVRHGAVVDVRCADTWSSSTHGGVEPGAVTLPLCAALVDRWMLVPEHEIAAAMRGCLARQHLLVEGAAGVAIAAALRDGQLRGRRAAVLICGGNLPWDDLTRLVGGRP